VPHLQRCRPAKAEIVEGVASTDGGIPAFRLLSSFPRYVSFEFVSLGGMACGIRDFDLT
jgi:hypothetical protein